MSLGAAVLVVVVGLAGPADGGVSCAGIERDLWTELSGLFMAMEPEGARRSIYDRATAAAGRCAGSEALAYVRVRVTELGAQGSADPAANREAYTTLARALALAFPRSVRIATVRARAVGKVEEARRAVALDPSYAPAQVALASALLSAGDAVAAETTMEGLERRGGPRGLARIDDGFTVLAQVKWARGDAAGAIDAANRELKGRDAVRVEPGGGDVRAIGAAHEILGLAYLKRGQPTQAAPHLIEAEAGSQRVQETVRNAGPALRKAIARCKRRQLSHGVQGRDALLDDVKR